MSAEHRRNPDSEECQKMHRENAAYIKSLQHPMTNQQQITTPRTQQAWDSCKHRDFPDIAQVMFAHGCTLERELAQKEQELASTISVANKADKAIQTILADAESERDKLRQALQRCWTMSMCRSEPYIPDYVRADMEAIMTNALNREKEGAND